MTGIPAADTPGEVVPFREAVRAWSRISLETFGGPAGQIAVMHRELVDDQDRLFVCAHRYAFETAAAVRLRAGTDSALVKVAVPPALIATKAHALRFATARRRSTKSGASDLYDLYRLASSHLPEIADGLAAARWDLRRQVAKALAADLADVERALAVLRAAPTLAPVDGDDFLEVITELLDRLNTPQS